MDEIIEDLQWLRHLKPESKVLLSNQAAEALQLPKHTKVSDVLEVLDRPSTVEDKEQYTLEELKSDSDMEL